MGHRKLSAPRKGSSALRPRKRSSRFLPRFRSWPELESNKLTLLGFVAYKVGMSHTFLIDDKPNSPTFGKEIFVPVTILEAPPMYALGIRVYRREDGQPKCLAEYWVNPPKELQLDRLLPTLSVSEDKMKKTVELINSSVDSLDFVRVLCATQPRLSPSLSKKKPELVEIQVGGGKDIKEKLDYAISLVGKEVYPSQVFQAGQLVDVLGVTKGKGFQGVVKRFHVQELPRWHKHRKGSRKVGTRGPFSQSYTPQPGQMGFHRRTEYNKRIIRIGNDVDFVNPTGGFVGYGLVRSWYIVLEGSVIGSRKRPLFLRYPIRPSWSPKSAPQIVLLDTSSKQG
jgi:large subunit ribosomal protein L3